MGETIHQVRHSAATKPPSHPVSDAIRRLNILGHVVDHEGRLTVDGEKVQLRVDRGRVVAEAHGVTIPFDMFARLLRPQDRRSFPPRGVDKHGIPSWAQGEDVVPVKERKDMRSA